MVNCGIQDGTSTTATVPCPDGFATGIFFDHQSTTVVAGDTIRGKGKRGPSVDYIGHHDGATNTILLSENLQATSYVPATSGQRRSISEADVGMIWDGAVPELAALAVATLGLGVDAVGADAVPGSIAFARPSSRHGGIVITSFCDGHRQQLRTDIDYSVFRQLMTPDGLKAGLLYSFDESTIR